MKIENWFTVPGGSDWDAPEIRGICVVGECPEHPKARNGKIQTSLVKRTEGRTVYTKSGSVYQLGEIDPGFLAHLKECGYPFDPENPIRVVDKLTKLEKKPN